MPAPRPNPYLVLLPLWLMVFSVSSQVLIISPILPRIAERLGMAESSLAPLVTGYAVAVATVALVMGPVSDKLGRRTVLLLGTGVMTLALALHGIAHGFLPLLAVRILAGAGGGALTGAAVAYVGDHFPPERRGWANGWITSGFAAGQIVAVPLGTLLAARFGYRAPFLAFALPMGLSFLLIWRLLPQPPVRRLEGPLDLRGGIAQYVVILRRRETAAAALIYLLTFMGTSLYVLYLPTWLEGTRGATPEQVALLFLAGGIATAVAGPLAGSLSDRAGRKPLIVGSGLGASVVMLATTGMGREVWTFYVLFFLLMALVAARATPFQALLTEIVPDDERGSLMSLMMALGQLGSGIGAAVAGVVYAAHGYTGNTVLAAASVLLLTLLVWRFVTEPEHGGAPSRAASS